MIASGSKHSSRKSLVFKDKGLRKRVQDRQKMKVRIIHFNVTISAVGKQQCNLLVKAAIHSSFTFVFVRGFPKRNASKNYRGEHYYQRLNDYRDFWDILI